MIMSDRAQFDLARQLRTDEGATIAEVFTFLSGLYFRGKLSYALAFAAPSTRVAEAYVITPGAGLVPSDSLVTLDWLHEMSAIDVDPKDARYRDPLDRDSRILRQSAGVGCEVILLGSIATPKYVGQPVHSDSNLTARAQGGLGKDDRKKGFPPAAGAVKSAKP